VQLHHNDDIKKMITQACQSLDIGSSFFFSLMVDRLVYGLAYDTLLTFLNACKDVWTDFLLAR
jgi:hypothetical protein